MLNTIAPFFIVDDLAATLAFYQSKLGFDVRYKAEATEPEMISSPSLDATGSC
jgi:catechol 2,3-dioxygenase-like lactoylglutathione lyase family enzyme